VGHWSGTYHVPREISDLQDLHLRLDSIVADRLALVCKSFLEQCLNGSDPSVWRVRHLSLNFSLDAGFSDAHGVARDWGRSLASEILSIVENDEVSNSVLRFPNRGAFLAQFLSDLVSGRAWGKWYYEEFSDLQALSNRQAICSIFLCRDTPSEELLLQIASIGQLENVLRVLNENDAQLIFELCFDSTAGALRHENLQQWAGIVLELWDSAPLRAGSRMENRFRDALRLFARTLSQYPAGKGDLELQAVINGLLELRRVLLEISKPSLIESLFEDLASFKVQSALKIAARYGVHDPTEALAFFAELMQGDVAWAHQAAAVLLGESNKDKFLTSKNISEGESILSSFGGVFLLGLSLTALSLDELSRCASETSDSSDKIAAILRHLSTVKCFGRTRFSDASDDPALRLFSGMERPSFQQALRDSNFQQLDLAGAHGVLLQSVLSRDESLEPVLFADLVPSPPDNSVFLLRELAHDEWLDAVPVSSQESDVSETLQSSLQRVSAVWKLDHPALFLGETLASRLDTPAPEQILHHVCELHRREEQTEEQLASQLGLTHPQLAYRLGSPAQHLPYFSLATNDSGLELDAGLDCLFTLVSRAALRHFSRKLFGFEFSSPDHIFENFLSGISEIRRVGERLEVQLPHSPLSLILRMAGLQDQRYAPAWLKGMEVWLLPPQE